MLTLLGDKSFKNAQLGHSVWLDWRRSLRKNENAVGSNVNVTNWGKDFFMTAASSAFHIVGLRTICSEDMNAQCKYYWQPWLSDSTDVGVALLHKWEGFFDDTIVSAFHTTDLTIKQYSLHNFPPEMFTGKEQSPLEQFSVLLKLCSEMKTNEISMQWLTKQSYFSKH